MSVVWNDTFEIKLSSVNDDLEITCEDNDLLGSKINGNTRIKGTALSSNGGNRNWYNFQ